MPNQSYRRAAQKVINVDRLGSFSNATARRALLLWVNDSLQSDFARIDDLRTGAAYCQLLDKLLPGKMPLKRVKFVTSCMKDFRHNYELLQTAFRAIGITKVIPIDQLTQGRYQENLEFLAWFKCFFDANYKRRHTYNALAARGGSDIKFAPPRTMPVSLFAADIEDGTYMTPRSSKGYVSAVQKQ